MHVSASGPSLTESSQESSLSDSVSSSTSSKPAKKVHFPRVKEAREALKEMALDLVKLQVQLIKEAAASGEYEAATKANQWLIEHTAAEDGTRIIDPSASKPKEVEGPRGPAIQIGIALGGVQHPSLPPAKVIDVTPLKDRNGD